MTACNEHGRGCVTSRLDPEFGRRLSVLANRAVRSSPASHPESGQGKGIQEWLRE
jgi:predicted transcriptional regulator